MRAAPARVGGGARRRCSRRPPRLGPGRGLGARRGRPVQAGLGLRRHRRALRRAAGRRDLADPAGDQRAAAGRAGRRARPVRDVAGGGDRAAPGQPAHPRHGDPDRVHRREQGQGGQPAAVQPDPGRAGFRGQPGDRQGRQPGHACRTSSATRPEDAKRRSTRRTCSTRRCRSPSSDADKGKALAQDPAAQAQVTPGTVVKVTVGTGLETVQVPPGIVGRSLDEATALLTAAKLQVVSSEVDGVEPLNQVTQMDPASGRTGAGGHARPAQRVELRADDDAARDEPVGQRGGRHAAGPSAGRATATP